MSCDHLFTGKISVELQQVVPDGSQPGSPLASTSGFRRACLRLVASVQKSCVFPEG